ncbi:MAG: hypothetical protein ACFFBD_30365, partial [Candidatus Hodarchaeota archaeon]
MVNLWSPNEPIRTIRKSKSCPAALRIIPITRMAIEKIFILAQRVSQLMRSHLEVYCFLIGNDEGIVEDILIPPQHVSHSFVEIPEAALDAVALSVKEIRSDYKILGWAHSHANFSVFSSGTDDRNHQTVLNQTLNLKLVNGTELKYAYGITVNEAREVYPVIITQYPCGTVIQRQGVLEIIESSNLQGRNKAKVTSEKDSEKTQISGTEELMYKKITQNIDHKINQNVNFGSFGRPLRKRNDLEIVYPSSAPMRIEKEPRFSLKEKKFKKRFRELKNGVKQFQDRFPGLLSEEKI